MCIHAYMDAHPTHTHKVIYWNIRQSHTKHHTPSHYSIFRKIPTQNILSKGIPRQAEVALGVPGRLRPRIFSTFGTTRVVGHQPNASAAFTPGEIPSTHFQRLSRPQDTWVCRKEPWKKSPVTPPGTDPGTVRLVAQCCRPLLLTVILVITISVWVTEFPVLLPVPFN